MHFDFVSDHLALDFAATVTWRTTARIELLTCPEDLADWIRQSGLLEPPDAPDAPDASGPPEAGDAGATPGPGILDAARELREAIYRTGVAVLRATSADPTDLRAIRRAAARPRVVPVLRGVGVLDYRGGLDEALATIAVSASELFGGPERRLIRACAREDCTRLFLDRSRAGSRRWCDKLRCGSQANSAAYRRRKTVR
ncbi:ABATE domain-containing protein [Streptomyces sparsogenes]|uniref:CGNR zinc finger domain-containing protein n=1 Tax=Streptomyces sparsogenes TaxID=67365 RepID=UPI0033F88AB1